MTAFGKLGDMEGADAEYARRILLAGPGNLETFTLQARTKETRNAYALAASRGTYNFEGLIARVIDEAKNPSPDNSRLRAEYDVRALLSLARVVANQSSDPEETYNAVQLFKFTNRVFGTGALKRVDRLVFLEALAALGWVRDTEKYSRLFKVSTLDRNQSDLLKANVWANRDRSTHAAMASEHWLDLVNSGYRKSGIETISFAPGEGPLFDRIISGPSEHIVHSAKVTVIVPTFNSGPRIATALRSLVNQTWRNIEILVMDDASPETNDKYLFDWEARDARIRVHKMDVNGGTYRARNYAISYLATGDFITVHDDDDWSHPRKIETQVRQLLARPSLVANMSLLSRATPDLVFTRINNNPVFTQPNYSSLMFRRSPVIDRIGFWDLVNRSADAEFHDRLKAEFGADASGVAGEDILSFLRVRPDSLTSGEIARGYIDRRRLWYQQSSREWHTRAKDEGQSLHVAAFPEAPRPFSAPVNMIGSKNDQDVVELDVLYATDFRFPGGNSSLAAIEIDLLVRAGYRVGMMQLASPVNGPKAFIRPQFLALSQSPLVSVVSTLDEVHAKLTLVRHPSVLQYPEPVRSGVHTDELVVIVNHAPRTNDGLGSIYDLPQVADMAQVIFGRAARFAPESELIRDAMRVETPAESMLPDSWPGIVSIQTNPERRVPPPARVIGRHSRDHVAKWPENVSRLSASYPTSGEFEVRVLGGAETPRKLLGQFPKNWVVHPFGSVAPAEFLADLPFWVYQHNSELVESFGMAAAEAMAAGCVVILPPYMSVNFGGGAVYAEPKDVVPTIEHFIASPDEYYAQRERAALVASERFGPEAFYSRISSLLLDARPLVR